MNVYRQLSQKFRKQLDEHVELYPNSYGSVKEDLVINEWVQDLKYSTFSALNGMNMMEPASTSMYDFITE